MFWKHKFRVSESTNQRPGFQLTYVSKTLAHDPALYLLSGYLENRVKNERKKFEIPTLLPSEWGNPEQENSKYLIYVLF